MKKLLAILLAVLMLVSSVPFAFAADDYKCNCDTTPILYVKGRTNIYKDRFGELNDENMAETNFSGGTDSILDAVKNILPAFGEALLTDKWDHYCDVLFEEIIPIYDGYKLNNDGEKDEGNTSGINPAWDIDNTIKSYETDGARYLHTSNSTYWPQFMQFQYDMRLDPCENAKDFKKAVDAVKEITGHDKINIICRCEGNVIVNAYFNMYKEEAKEEIESVIMYNSIASGAEIADELYSNKVTLDPEAMNRFIDGFLDTSPVLDLVKETVNLATYTGILGEGLGFVEEIYDKISLNLMPRLIREIFGTCPGWWGMVSPEAVEAAKDFVLETDNADGKYDKLIEKIDNYNVYKANARNILEEMQENGVKVYVIAKYGEQIYPVIDNSDLLGDGVVSLAKQTFNGATTSKINTVLSDDYIGGRIDAGFEKYISGDKKVDGSTSAFPDHTWYIRNLPHHDYPWVMELFMCDILCFDGYATPEAMGEGYERFLHYEETIEDIFSLKDELVGKLEPITKETEKEETGASGDLNNKPENEKRFSIIIRFFTALFNFLTSLFKK